MCNQGQQGVSTMRLLEICNPVPALQNRNKMENFIDQSLLGDWIIRVEYSGNNSQGQRGWIQWGSTMFAIRSPDEVMEAIDACHTNYPEQEIRIYAEKVRPQVRIVYSVYRASEPGLKHLATVNGPSDAANQEWLQSGGQAVPVRTKSAWRFIAAAGALAGTFIVWEAASS